MDNNNIIVANLIISCASLFLTPLITALANFLMRTRVSKCCGSEIDLDSYTKKDFEEFNKYLLEKNKLDL
jgi:hypothetical protein